MHGVLIVPLQAGYFRFSRGGNLCGIEQEATTAILK